MIEVIVDGITARNKLFDSYDINSYYSNERIIPKNNEIKKYCRFLKDYLNKYSKEENLIGYFIADIPENYEKQNYSIIEEDDYFVFEFPDEMEEDIFYFKMKYC